MIGEWKNPSCTRILCYFALGKIYLANSETVHSGEDSSKSTYLMGMDTKVFRIDLF